MEKKIIILIKIIMVKTINQIRIVGNLTDLSKMNTGLQQRDSWATTLFNLSLKEIIRDTQIDDSGTLTRKSIQVIGLHGPKTGKGN